MTEPDPDELAATIRALAEAITKARTDEVIAEMAARLDDQVVPLIKGDEVVLCGRTDRWRTTTQSAKRS